MVRCIRGTIPGVLESQLLVLVLEKGFRFAFSVQISVLHFSFLQSSFVFRCSFLPVQPLHIVLPVSQFHFRPHLCAGSREGTHLDRSRDGNMVNGRALCAS